MKYLGKLIDAPSKVFKYYGEIKVNDEMIPIAGYQTQTRGKNYVNLYIVGERELEAVQKGIPFDFEDEPEKVVQKKQEPESNEAHFAEDEDTVEDEEIEMIPFTYEEERERPKKKKNTDQLPLFQQEEL